MNISIAENKKRTNKETAKYKSRSAKQCLYTAVELSNSYYSVVPAAVRLSTKLCMEQLGYSYLYAPY